MYLDKREMVKCFYYLSRKLILETIYSPDKLDRKKAAPANKYAQAGNNLNRR